MRLHAVGTARDEGLIARYAGDASAAARVLRPGVRRASRAWGYHHPGARGGRARGRTTSSGASTTPTRRPAKARGWLGPQTLSHLEPGEDASESDTNAASGCVADRVVGDHSCAALRRERREDRDGGFETVGREAERQPQEPLEQARGAEARAGREERAVLARLHGEAGADRRRQLRPRRTGRPGDGRSARPGAGGRARRRASLGARARAPAGRGRSRRRTGARATASSCSRTGPARSLPERVAARRWTRHRDRLGSSRCAAHPTPTSPSEPIVIARRDMRPPAREDRRRRGPGRRTSRRSRRRCPPVRAGAARDGGTRRRGASRSGSGSRGSGRRARSPTSPPRLQSRRDPSRRRRRGRRAGGARPRGASRARPDTSAARRSRAGRGEGAPGPPGRAPCSAPLVDQDLLGARRQASLVEAARDGGAQERQPERLVPVMVEPARQPSRRLDGELGEQRRRGQRGDAQVEPVGAGRRHRTRRDGRRAASPSFRRPAGLPGTRRCAAGRRQRHGRAADAELRGELALGGQPRLRREQPVEYERPQRRRQPLLRRPTVAPLAEELRKPGCARPLHQTTDSRLACSMPVQLRHACLVLRAATPPPPDPALRRPRPLRAQRGLLLLAGLGAGSLGRAPPGALAAVRPRRRHVVDHRRRAACSRSGSRCASGRARNAQQRRPRRPDDGRRPGRHSRRRTTSWPARG